ncbi:hypothetical protein HQQ81_22305 [Microbacteriaceae bacterium VKM Ac-2854]|nr:hypothetical protein [Microbacteriaceae bacterium VKM Ac-2854]
MAANDFPPLLVRDPLGAGSEDEGLLQFLEGLSNLVPHRGVGGVELFAVLQELLLTMVPVGGVVLMQV